MKFEKRNEIERSDFNVSQECEKNPSFNEYFSNKTKSKTVEKTVYCFILPFLIHMF